MATKKRGTRSSTRGGARRSRKALPAGFGKSRSKQPPGELLAQLKAQLAEAREALERAEATLDALSHPTMQAMMIGPTGAGDQE